jgi:hypothetical protein
MLPTLFPALLQSVMAHRSNKFNSSNILPTVDMELEFLGSIEDKEAYWLSRG